jgi:hypothetical protein
MAVRRTVIRTDDLDGGEASHTVRFGLDGTSYEIDLNDTNAAALRDLLSRYTKHGRMIGRRTGTAGDRTHIENPDQIRAWAQSNGIDVPPRGRIPETVKQQFRAAHRDCCTNG